MNEKAPRSPYLLGPLSAEHSRFMHEALRVAEQCRDIEWYGVGCVIVNCDGAIISTGYTGELLEDTKMRHAEDVAISKALEGGYNLATPGVTLYSTLEPCSVRASGKTPCCQHIIDCGICTVVYGAKEPFDESLGIVCQGEAVLRDRGVHVVFLQEFEEVCLKVTVSHRR
jgi:pyrimidine deaminase RibD-like protein